MSEESAVFTEVTRSEDNATVISDGCARTVAAWWHSGSGEGVPLLALSSSGAITEGILDSIDRCISEADADQVRALKALRVYCTERIANNDTEQRPRWDNIWVC